jgi:hypothetical protein
VPHDPRTGYYGHQLSHLDQQPPVRSENSTSSSSGRRRRALGDDGTGGTRVIDLLSKHGKAPGPSTGSHRRQAEPSPQTTDGASNGVHGATNGLHGPSNGTSNGLHSPTNGLHSPTNGFHGATNGADVSEAGANGFNGTNGPSSPRIAAPPGRFDSQPAESRYERPAPPETTRRVPGNRPHPPRPAPPPGAEPRSTPLPPSATDARLAPPGAETRPAFAPGTQRGRRPAPPPERPGAPRRPAETPSGRWPRPAPPRPNGFAVSGGVAAASGAATHVPEAGDAEVTRIAEALSGKPAPPPEAWQRGPRRPEQQPAARPGRPAPAAGPEASGPHRAPPPPDALTTAPAESRKPDAVNGTDAPVDAADVKVDNDSAEVKAIDATLARFSAVHDQIAEEEAARRKRYSWLYGKRKEPELGQDMPFDFVEGRDAQSSRVQWKKKQRKKRIRWVLQLLMIIAALGVAAVLVLRWMT